ncbi:hypothetical protein LBBP_00976 [Leptospira borgpetersenii serovar Ballum]|uniref:Uncharacterized protein n=1 Tax=Leptospira borgpetersenii serovar Ballum TaxID=280505 RepID=A0A0S2INQ6_LEPBO|nr:hypothetical protein LBBP_00976 [Leptospira borgpetersenii serovar Ballum]
MVFCFLKWIVTRSRTKDTFKLILFIAVLFLKRSQYFLQ